MQKMEKINDANNGHLNDDGSEYLKSQWCNW